MFLLLHQGVTKKYQMLAKDLLLFTQYQMRRGQAVSSFFEFQKQKKAFADIWCFIFGF